jgi:tRNA (cytidine/uridine-2'-O-)-methyltransferase
LLNEKPLPGIYKIALICPDIPQNTGNIARLCLASGSRLILVRPFGFRLTDQQIRRAGMDYWEKVEKEIFDSVEEFLEKEKKSRLFFFSVKGKKNYSRVAYQAGDILCFGAESSGLPPGILATATEKERDLYIPMVPGARCLNVASSAAIALYEAIRQAMDVPK